MDHGIDTFRLANVLMKEFNYKEFNEAEVYEQFKKKCDCERPTLIRVYGAVSEHILSLKDVKYEVVKEL
jgi:hypothetical protein